MLHSDRTKKKTRRRNRTKRHKLNTLIKTMWIWNGLHANMRIDYYKERVCVCDSKWVSVCTFVVYYIVQWSAQFLVDYELWIMVFRLILLALRCNSRAIRLHWEPNLKRILLIKMMQTSLLSDTIGVRFDE